MSVDVRAIRAAPQPAELADARDWRRTRVVEWTSGFFAVGGPSENSPSTPSTALRDHPSRALPDERCPAGQGSTVLLHVFIHLTETFTYQISLKGNIQNLEAN